MFACHAGSVECLEAILDAGADPNSVGGDPSFTALYVAAAEGHLDCVKLLLARGTNPAAVMDGGETALTIAAKQGHEGCVRALLEVSQDWRGATGQLQAC